MAPTSCTVKHMKSIRSCCRAIRLCCFLGAIRHWRAAINLNCDNRRLLLVQWNGKRDSMYQILCQCSRESLSLWLASISKGSNDNTVQFWISSHIIPIRRTQTDLDPSNSRRCSVSHPQHWRFYISCQWRHPIRLRGTHWSISLESGWIRFRPIILFIYYAI